MATVTVTYGEKIKTVEAATGSLVGAAVAASELPLEQPCAGRGTCGKCKILAESGLAPPDLVERANLTAGELAVGTRLACRARVESDVHVTLAPIVVYSNKIFRAGNQYKRSSEPLGVAIDLGSTTVGAFLAILGEGGGEVCAGAAGLNQQTVYGADIMSRLAAADDNPVDAERLRRLAVASINQAVDSLQLPARARRRILRVTVVGNVAMHHLLARLPVASLVALPFQPYRRTAVRDATGLMAGIFPAGATVMLPPLIGGFVGSDALACLAYFGFENAPGPVAAIDLGTNGEVMVTTGGPHGRILVASTAAGPAFEGVNISCGTRAVDGAIVAARLNGGDFDFETIAGAEAAGLTGSGLLSVIHELRRAGVIEPNGRITPEPPFFTGRLVADEHGVRSLPLTADGRLLLTQFDVRELQKAKGAIRAAVDILLAELGLEPADLERLILTGSFGGQIDIEAALALGLIPPVRREVVQTIANGAGMGAAIFLRDDGFELGERLAARAEQIDLDLSADFNLRYIDAMALVPGDS
jgi:uncharacterized 2Fe-2S/4Fe-4S cluster protein (DUF4445 family)